VITVVYRESLLFILSPCCRLLVSQHNSVQYVSCCPFVMSHEVHGNTEAFGQFESIVWQLVKGGCSCVHMIEFNARSKISAAART